MKAYKIDCEWDMGFYEAYATKELANQAIEDIDWESEMDMTLEEVKDDGLVYVDEFEIYEG